MSIVISSDFPGTKFTVSRYGVAMHFTREELEFLQIMIGRALRPVTYEELVAEADDLPEVEINEYV